MQNKNVCLWQKNSDLIDHSGPWNRLKQKIKNSKNDNLHQTNKKTGKYLQEYLLNKNPSLGGDSRGALDSRSTRVPVKVNTGLPGTLRRDEGISLVLGRHKLRGNKLRSWRGFFQDFLWLNMVKVILLVKWNANQARHKHRGHRSWRWVPIFFFLLLLTDTFLDFESYSVDFLGYKKQSNFKTQTSSVT